MKRMVIVVLILCLVGSPRSDAGIPVFDFENWKANFVTAASSAAQLTEFIEYYDTFKQYRDKFNEYKGEFDKYRNIVKDFQEWRNRFDKRKLRSLGVAEIGRLAKDMGVEVGVLSDVLASAQSVGGNLRQLNDMYRQFESGANFAQMTKQQFAAFERERFKRHRDADRSFYANLTSIVGQVQRDINKLNQLRAAIPEDANNDGATSLRAVMEVSASHLNVMANQNAQFMTLLTQEQLVKQASAINERTAAQARLAQEKNRYAEEWQALNGHARATCGRMRVAWKNSFMPCATDAPTPQADD